MELTNYPYRVFVSYADRDRPDALRIVSRLRQLKLQPVWDQDNRGGWPYVEITKKRIAHSHVFLPLLTPRSVRSTWVNHEIGFAVGRNVPVLPVSLGPMPGGMAGALHAEAANNMDALVRHLTRKRIDALVEGSPSVEVYEFADHSESRTAAIVSHCRELAGLAFPRPQRLRHRAAFGSFSLPASPDDSIWSRRYDGEPWRENLAVRREALSEERRLLEQHAMQFGCDLILHPTLPHLTPVAIAARIEIIRSFLVRINEMRVPVRVIFDQAALRGNVLIVGDWFWAESITPQADGYRHTALTSHAPTVLGRIVQYDRIFESLGSWMSADAAVKWLDQHLPAYTRQASP